ncbi:MAG TPA: universal stress protein [Acetobacteraceae bacterium]|nr:universal stress protein [Acetobacteraceae bacterium]
MFRYILVPAPGSAAHDAVFTTALALARQSGGHLHFLHVRLDVQMMLVAMSSGDYGGGAGLGDVLDSLEREVDARHDAARKAVFAFCEREHVTLADSPVAGAPSATFRVETGDEARLLAARGRTADVTVLGRAADGEAVTLDLLEAALLSSGRPVLIAPARAPQHLGRRIAIGWKDTPEAARAVSAALPLIGAAEAVTVISVQEDGGQDDGSAARLSHALLWHNQATTLQVVPPGGADPAEVLLSAAAKAGADLLVMGGYSHSRMREAVFGGVTRHVLRASPLPVLMAH